MNTPFVRIATFSNPNDAHLLATRLLANGIEVQIPENNIPIYMVSIEFPIAVRAEDVEKAIELMQQPYLRIVR